MPEVPDPIPALFRPPQVPNPSRIAHYTFNQLDWREVDGYQGSYEGDDSRESRVFDVHWDERQQFVEAMLGYTDAEFDPAGSLEAGESVGRLLRVLPAQFPTKPWLYAWRVEQVAVMGAWKEATNVFALDDIGNVQIKGAEPNETMQPLPMIEYFDPEPPFQESSYGLVRYRVHYKALPYEVRSDLEARALRDAEGLPEEITRWVTRVPTYSMTALNLIGQIVFKEGPVGVIDQLIPGNAAHLLVPLVQWQYTWHQVPDVPETAIRNCRGKVNDAVFDGAPGVSSFPAGTLLFQTVAIPPRQRSVRGRVLWNITYTFLYKESGWNYLPAKDGVYYRVGYKDPPGSGLYPNANFDKLFIPPLPLVYQ